MVRGQFYQKHPLHCYLNETKHQQKQEIYSSICIKRGGGFPLKVSKWANGMVAFGGGSGRDQLIEVGGGGC